MFVVPCLFTKQQQHNTKQLCCQVWRILDKEYVIVSSTFTHTTTPIIKRHTRAHTLSFTHTHPHTLVTCARTRMHGHHSQKPWWIYFLKNHKKLYVSNWKRLFYNVGPRTPPFRTEKFNNPCFKCHFRNINKYEYTCIWTNLQLKPVRVFGQSIKYLMGEKSYNFIL